MPPFGNVWFGPLAEEGNPLGILRLCWMAESRAEDDRVDFERSKFEAEMGAMYTAPAEYNRVKQFEKGTLVVDESEFRVIKTHEDFTRRLNMAKRGEVEIKEQDLEIRDRVREVRAKIESALTADPRIHTPVPDDYYSVDDGPTIERVSLPQIQRPDRKG